MKGSFSVSLPSQPPSWNRSYRIVHAKAKDAYGQPVFDSSGKAKTYSTLAKQQAVIDYQTSAANIIRAAKPSGFKPEGFIYVVYDFYLARDIDCDNVMKAINDVLALVLDVNDRTFLPVARSKVTGAKNPFVSLVILDSKQWKVKLEQL